MEYLPLANKVQEGDYVVSPVSAEGKHVVVIGGGDTGADCVGTAHRQGAASVTQLEIMPRPNEERHPTGQPWPTFPILYKVTSAHEEGGERIYSASTTRFEGDEDGNVQWLHLAEVEFVDGKLTRKPGTERVSRPSWSRWPWASRAPTARTVWWSSSAWSWTSGVTSPATPTSRPTCRGCSSPVTPAAGSP